MAAVEYVDFVLRKAGTFVDRSGIRYGLLLAVRPMRSTGSRGEAFWECSCDCGTTTIARGSALEAGQRSCGCVKDLIAGELLRAAGEPYRFKRSHGHAGTSRDKSTSSPTYHSWNGLKTRCSNPRDSGFPRYGGRGITYDPRWERFDNFLADMGECPLGMQLDRINNDGNYTRENCRWVTRIENMANRSNTRFIMLHGERIPLSEFARRCGIKYDTVLCRFRRGMTAEEIASTPLRVGGGGRRRG